MVAVPPLWAAGRRIRRDYRVELVAFGPRDSIYPTRHSRNQTPVGGKILVVLSKVSSVRDWRRTGSSTSRVPATGAGKWGFSASVHRAAMHLGRRAGAGEVAIAVDVVDAGHRRPVLVLPRAGEREERPRLRAGAIPALRDQQVRACGVLADAGPVRSMRSSRVGTPMASSIASTSCGAGPM